MALLAVLAAVAGKMATVAQEHQDKVLLVVAAHQLLGVQAVVALEQRGKTRPVTTAMAALAVLVLLPVSQEHPCFVQAAVAAAARPFAALVVQAATAAAATAKH